MSEEEFRQLLAQKGFGDAKIKEYMPSLDEPMHSHELSAIALVMSGEFTLALESESTTFGPGEWCELEAGTVHTERTGPNGATLLLAFK
jgi:quercetin dioxygenase-like cupin family protein